MRISAWSSDVCSSDLDAAAPAVAAAAHRRAEQAAALVIADRLDPDPARGGQFADGELHRLTPYHGTDAIWDAMTKQAILHRMVMKDHICPYGLKAKHLLKSRGFAVDDRWLTTRAETDAFKAEHGVRSEEHTSVLQS